ncbi:PPE family protein [Mycobacterium sp. 663a-19]|uniref:PPE family protein n=1 Tax=Mycobacterium sp. 663a-19 TaxID=2986148 RepID=UPI002D1E7F02|nr:PPE family protein [Mycobacterium sp. 663a-19]MEB3983469.1 PPE family protein [Mycobacterium sp. 663a-19]
MFFPWLPPEINSALMYAGAGPGPLLAASSAWDALAADLAGAASSFDSVISGLTGGMWTGPSSLAMAAAAVPYVAWLNAAAAQASGASAQALAAAAAFETAQLATVHPSAVTANRLRLMVLIATNFLGQNTPAIAMTELEYLEMWALDVAAMTGYHASAMSVASTLPSFSAPPVGLAGLGAGLGNIFSSIVSSLSGLLPVGGLAGVAGQIQTLIAGIPAALSSAVGQLSATLSVPVASLVSVAQAGIYPASMVATPMMGLAQVANVANGAGLVSSVTPGMSNVPQFVGSPAPQLNPLSSAATGLGPVGAGIGQARFVGAISVPPTWQGAMPMRLAAPAMSALPSAALAEAAEVAPATAGPVSPMPVGVGANGVPKKMTGRGVHVVPTRPTVVPRTGAG